MGKIDYANQLSQIPQSGYNTAIQYYKSLKNQFENSLEVVVETNIGNLIMRDTKQLIEAIANKLNNGIDSSDGATSFEILNEIFSDFAMSDEISNLRELALQIIREKEKEIDVSEAKSRNDFIQWYEQDLRTGGDFDNYLQSVLKRVINTSSRNLQSETLQAIVDRANQMFRIAISAYLQNRQEYKLTGFPSITMQGFIREQLELNALQKIFANTNLNVQHGGVKTVGGKETEFDIILSFLNNMDTLDTQIQGTKQLLLDPHSMIHQLLPQIQHYGEQVKSFNIHTQKIVKGRMAGLRISDNATLQQQLSSKAQNNYVTLTQNLKFMAQSKNIIQSFGPATVLFSSGAGRQWTFEFIQDFRENNYYLMLNYIRAGQVGSTVQINQPVLQTKKGLQKNKYYRSRWN